MRDFFKYTLATITGIILISVIGLFIMLAVFGALVASTEKQVVVQNQSMLILKLDNQIVDRAPNDPFANLEIPGLSMAKKLGLDKIIKAIEKARDDDRIKGIFLDVSVMNSGMAAVEEIRNALIAFRDSSSKPVYAYSDLYEQKTYYLASVADKVVLNPRGRLDFRGLGGEVTFYKNALEKLGVEMQVVRHGKFKSAVEPFLLEEMSPENREQRLVYMGSMWNHMLNGISQERGIPVDRLNELADQMMTFRSAATALEAGLVDTLKYKDQVLDDLRQITGTAAKKGINVVNVADYAKAPLKKGAKKSTFSRNKIAVIYASGEIGTSIVSGEGINGDKLSREIRKVRQDSSYKAIVLRVNSPGGDAYASEVIWREVKLAADEKTVVVSMGDVAASGGYYIACAADKIVAHPNTITGSIGVFGMIPNAGELLGETLGITTDVVKTNEHSDMPSLTRPMSPFERNLMQSFIEETYALFVSRVADGRKMESAAVDSIGQGRVWSGENALNIGLVDELGGLDKAVEMAADLAGLENYRTVSLPELSDPFTEMLKGGSDNARTWFLKRELGEAWIYYDRIAKLRQMNGLYARMPYDVTIR
ncbi:MAG TPA: signal peptide peptidase SppA [Prolixibacteraceae bacterium]|jgi:protease-4|nr:signal peptide peptidase SppA [Prolixibacteraceae bacterium]NLS99178.1 signal peptide peptidase SppA [Bacteroidales bacterium]HNU77189.1 signal peptide peptidase SppA [Prolixibacteraceae bacterium]HNZ69957.1 signal peptide peptidase SppA [Prolixibacteraceae bacterium]HOC87177.1 signal peptide peptidase SppA [Prolixibacteraceae bacterium]